MSLPQIPVRLTTGAFILNAGIGKLSADEGTAQFLHGAAASTYPSPSSRTWSRRSSRGCSR